MLTFFKYIKLIPYIIIFSLVLLLISKNCTIQHLKQENTYLSSKTNNNNVILPNNTKNFKKELNNIVTPKEIKQNNIKKKNIKQATKTILKDSINIITIVIDSIINDTIQVQCINYQDNYNKVFGCIKNDTANYTIIIQDTLTHIVSNQPTKRFLFIKYKKELQLITINKNPFIKYNSITVIKQKI